MSHAERCFFICAGAKNALAETARAKIRFARLKKHTKGRGRRGGREIKRREGEKEKDRWEKTMYKREKEDRR